MDTFSQARSVFAWSDYDAWRQVVSAFVVTAWGDTIVSTFTRHPPPYVFVGSLAWLVDFLPPHTTEGIEDIESVLVDAFRKTWTHVKAFHATCVNSAASFYNRGIQPINLEESNRWAVEFFSGRCPRLRASGIEITLASLGALYDKSDERTFFAIDKRHLIQHCPHYMLYGSEYLLAFAECLVPADGNGRSCDYRRHLTGRGTPLVLECIVPTERLADGVILELVRILVAETFRGILDAKHVPETRRLGFPISGALGADYILGHERPSDLVDPLQKFIDAGKYGLACLSACKRW